MPLQGLHRLTLSSSRDPPVPAHYCCSPSFHTSPSYLSTLPSCPHGTWSYLTTPHTHSLVFLYAHPRLRFAVFKERAL